MKIALSIGVGLLCILPSIAAPSLDSLSAKQVSLGKISVQPDVVYATLAGYRPLHLDLYQPPLADRPRPLVIFIHGGAWTTGHKRQTAVYQDWPTVLANLSIRGYVVAALEYRLSSEAPFPAALHDVKSALRFLRANADQFGIDPARAAFWGASAGAHLASMAAITPGNPALSPAGSAPSAHDRVQALVGWYGPYDVRPLYTFSKSAPLEKLSPRDRDETLGGLTFLTAPNPAEQENFLKLACAATHLDATDPPTLLLHGTGDTLVPHSQSREFAEKLRSHGVPVSIHELSDVGHGWSHVDPVRAAAAAQEAVALTTAWLEKALPP